MQLDREFSWKTWQEVLRQKKSGQPKLPCLLMIFEKLRW